MDLIDREQAIAEIHLAFGAKPAVHAQAVSILNSLPSAEMPNKWIFFNENNEIDREETIEALKSLEKEAKALFWEYDPFDKHTKFEKLAFGYLIGLVQDLGAIIDGSQGAEKTGKWIDRGSLSCRCSECGCKSPKEYDYCPNCGARMGGNDNHYDNENNL